MFLLTNEEAKAREIILACNIIKNNLSLLNNEELNELFHNFEVNFKIEMNITKEKYMI